MFSARSAQGLVLAPPFTPLGPWIRRANPEGWSSGLRHRFEKPAWGASPPWLDLFSANTNLLFYTGQA